MELVLEQVKQFADQAHGDQTRKYSSDRYIVHPMRVMNICQEYTDSIPVLCAAILHDVLEDTPITKEILTEFLHNTLDGPAAAKTLQLVEELTDVYIKKDFPNLNRRKRKLKETDRLKNASSDAQTIKYADIMDNCPEITQNDPEFAARYLRECRQLLGKMRKGNQDLQRRAMDIVNNCMRQLEADKKNESIRTS